MARTACLVCLVITVNGRIQKSFGRGGVGSRLGSKPGIFKFISIFFTAELLSLVPIF
jgi:hypothetical protein